MWEGELCSTEGEQHVQRPDGNENRRSRRSFKYRVTQV